MPELLPQFKHSKWDKSLYADLLSKVWLWAWWVQLYLSRCGFTVFVNTFAVIISAQTAARRIMTFALLPMTAISSMTTFASESLGAKDLTALSAIRIGSRLSISCSFCLFSSFCQPSLGFLASSIDGYLIEMVHLQPSSAFIPFWASWLIYRNCLQAWAEDPSSSF